MPTCSSWARRTRLQRSTYIGATTLWDPWDASPPTFKDVGTKIIWPPTFTGGCFCCTRLIVTNDQTNVFNCSLLLNTGVGRRLVMITSGEGNVSVWPVSHLLATWQHARAVPVKLLLPMHYVEKMNLTFPTFWSLPTFKTWLRLWALTVAYKIKMEYNMNK